MSIPDINKLAHDLIAENKALETIIKAHRMGNFGINKAYDLLCFIIIYPHIIESIKSNNPSNTRPHIELERICLNVNESESGKINEILDNIDDEYEKILLIITIAQVATFKPETRERLSSIMEKYAEFQLILEIYGCLN